jgi:hypothetical protein
MKILGYVITALLLFVVSMAADDITLVDGKAVFHNAKIISHDAQSVNHQAFFLLLATSQNAGVGFSRRRQNSIDRLSRPGTASGGFGIASRPLARRSFPVHAQPVSPLPGLDRSVLLPD